MPNGITFHLSAFYFAKLTLLSLAQPLHLFKVKLVPKRYEVPIMNKKQNAILSLLLTASIVWTLRMLFTHTNTGWLSVISYLFTFLLVWLLLSMNLLKHSIKRIYDFPTSEEVESAASLLRRTIAITRFVHRSYFPV